MQLTGVEDCRALILTPVVRRRHLACPCRKSPAPHPEPDPPIVLTRNLVSHPLLPLNPVPVAVGRLPRGCRPARWRHRMMGKQAATAHPPPRRSRGKRIATLLPSLIWMRTAVPTATVIAAVRWIGTWTSMTRSSWNFVWTVAVWTASWVGWAVSSNRRRPATSGPRGPVGEADSGNGCAWGQPPQLTG